MKCAICKNKTDWDTSFGRPVFVVCPTCHNRLEKVISHLRKYDFSPKGSATQIIVEIGFMMEERKDKNG